MGWVPCWWPMTRSDNPQKCSSTDRLFSRKDYITGRYYRRYSGFFSNRRFAFWAFLHQTVHIRSWMMNLRNPIEMDKHDFNDPYEVLVSVRWGPHRKIPGSQVGKKNYRFLWREPLMNQPSGNPWVFRCLAYTSYVYIIYMHTLYYPLI